MVKGERYYGSIPISDEAKTKIEAKEIVAGIKRQVRAGTYRPEKIENLDDFATFVDEVYLSYSKDHKASHYHDKFRCKVLKEYFKGKKFSDITPMLVRKYIKERLESTTQRVEIKADGEKENRLRSPVTVHKEVVLLSSIFRMAIEEGVAQNNPCSAIGKSVRKKLKARNKRQRYLTLDEEKRLLNALTGPREHLRPVVQLALWTGMRQGELLSMQWEHNNLGSLPVQMIVGKDLYEVRPNHLLIPKSKNGKPRVIALNNAAVALLRIMAQDATKGKYVFENPMTGKPLKWIVKHGFPSACIEAKIPYGVDTPNGLTFHDLRHTWATRACECGVDPYTIRDVLGHSTVAMSADYTHSTPEARQRAMEAVGQYSQKIASNLRQMKRMKRA
jgi:integrase